MKMLLKFPISGTPYNNLYFAIVTLYQNKTPYDDDAKYNIQLITYIKLYYMYSTGTFKYVRIKVIVKYSTSDLLLLKDTAYFNILINIICV